MQYLKSSSL